MQVPNTPPSRLQKFHLLLNNFCTGATKRAVFLGPYSVLSAADTCGLCLGSVLKVEHRERGERRGGRGRGGEGERGSAHDHAFPRPVDTIQQCLCWQTLRDGFRKALTSLRVLLYFDPLCSIHINMFCSKTRCAPIPILDWCQIPRQPRIWRDGPQSGGGMMTNSPLASLGNLISILIFDKDAD